VAPDRQSDVVAALLIGVATFSKPPNGLLIVPILYGRMSQRRLRAAVAIGIAFGLIVGGLFALNLGVSGDWNSPGWGAQYLLRGVPFQTADAGFDVGMERATNQVLTNIVFDPSVFWSRLGSNVVYFFFGRHSGMVPYFFPGVFALAAFLWPGARRASWQWLIFAVAIVEILLILIWIPYNYFGGGRRARQSLLHECVRPVPVSPAAARLGRPGAGTVGRRRTVHGEDRPQSLLFVVLSAEHAKAGPLRWLPVEMTLINDLPINTRLDRVRVAFGP
jgi:MFS family permease